MIKRLLIALLLVVTSLVGEARAQTPTIHGMTWKPTKFAQLTSSSIVSQSNGTGPVWCPDCHQTTVCSGGGTGAFAFRMGSAWSCSSATNSVVGLTNPLIAPLDFAGFLAENIASLAPHADASAPHTIGSPSGAGFSQQARYNITDPYFIGGAATGLPLCANGADPSGTNDSTCAINNAIQYAYTHGIIVDFFQTPDLYAPPGHYKICAGNIPILFNGNNSSGGSSPGSYRVHFHGDNEIGTNFGCASNVPAMVVVSPTYMSALGTLAATPLVGSAPHVSLAFNAGLPYYIDPKDTTAATLGNAFLGGQGSTTIEGYFKDSDVTGSDEGDLFWVGAKNDLPNFNTAIFFTVAGNLHAKWKINGSVLTAEGGTVTAGTIYYFKTIYDATNGFICTYLSSALGTSGVSPVAHTSATASSTVTEVPADQPAIGLRSLVVNGGKTGTPFNGVLDSFRIESGGSCGAAGTATIAIPNAPLAKDGSTLYLLDGSTFTASNIGANGIIQTDWPVGGALVHNPTYLGNAQGPTLENFGIDGGSWAIFNAESPQSQYHHISAQNQTYGSFAWYNNTYNGNYTYLNATPLSTATYDFAVGWPIGKGEHWTGHTSYYDLACSNTGCGYLDNFNPNNPTGGAAAYIGGGGDGIFGNTVLKDAEFDCEGSGNANGVEIYTGSTGSTPPAGALGRISLEGSFCSQGSGLTIAMDDTDGPKVSVSDGTALYNGAGGTDAIQFLQTTSYVGDIVDVVNPLLNGNTLTNEPQWVARNGLTTTTFAQLPATCLPGVDKTYCSDCKSVADAVTMASTCVDSGTGSLAICKGSNVWKCGQ